jgi:uncharacterized membrane protein
MVHGHATFSLQKGWRYNRGITILKSYITQCLGNLNVDFKIVICDDFYCIQVTCLTLCMLSFIVKQLGPLVEPGLPGALLTGNDE